ncbi:MAG: hypothetical protein A2669_01970 [Candidatus Yanofskybacteria bacterium RIFCSPHIGHO2_01_FULL_48_25b]|uniref:Uncharacterized protein n=1 Tax=Candidatus Yanofskybacteria bacterium RIFCSPHIGHO2_01_FULL_48_25b TaxID=1802672 RepID=A0A1F8F2W1_9BACT|nr:MAG: hypothetical protein A2669_01970 [Candidatus Yanofskybacteria bacterium RIFCSPHIGHO2_01_FULL_48_25b]
MFKLLIFIVLIVAIAVLTPLGQQLKARVITYVNPTAAEREVINNLQNKLSTISKTINKSDFQKLKSPEQIKELNKMLEETQSIAAKAGEIAEKSDITAAISNIIQKFIPGDTPAPAVCPTHNF